MATNNNPIKYSDLVRPDDSITKLIAQLDQLSDAYMNALRNIKREAITVRTSMQTMSGATDEGRKSIRAATTSADKLIQKERQLEEAAQEYQLQLASLNALLRQRQSYNKLEAQLNGSLEGSYNRLSAQYSLNKIALNEMSLAERETTEYGRNLVIETRAIYQEMNRLQSETGKNTLNVGNYASATRGLTTQVEQQTKQLALMRLEGQKDTEEYRRLSQETAVLRDAIRDARTEVRNMASDTSALDSVLGAAGAAAGGFSAFTGAMQLFGSESENVEEAQRKLQAAIAITTGVQSIQNAVQRQSALMLGISRVQQTALSRAKVYDRLVSIQGTKATLAATIAQRGFNLVAAANPYVLLAVALISVVGALVLFSRRTGEAAKDQQRLNQLTQTQIEYLQTEATELNRVSNERVKQLNNELSLAQARNASTQETRRLEDQILQERTSAHNRSVGFYAEEITNLETNRDRLNQLRQALERVNTARANGERSIEIDVDLDGNIDRIKVDEAIEAIQGQIDNLGRSVEIAVDITTAGNDLNNEMAVLNARRLQENRELVKAETDIIRAAQDARIALIQNSFNQERMQRYAANNRAIADIRLRLETEANLTRNARRALNDQIVSLRQQLANELIDIANQQRAAELDEERITEDMRLAVMANGAERQREELRITYDRQIQDINTRLETERSLTTAQTTELLNQLTLLQQQYAKERGELEDQITIDQMNKEAARTQLRIETAREGSEEEINLRIRLLQQQRAIELAANRQLAEDVRQSEADINARFDAEVLRVTTNLTQQRALLLFDQQQALEESEFNLLRNSEERKTRFRLAQERARLQKILELNQSAGVKLTDVEVQTIQNTIARINQEMDKSTSQERGSDIYGLFGLNLDDDQKDAINTSVNFAIEQLQQLAAARVAAAEAAVNAAKTEVDSAKNAVDAEIEARNNGYANNVVQAQKELDLARRNQDKALREQERAQRAQEAIQSIQQGSNLITAAAMIWAQLGFPTAIPAIALMFGSFAYSKIRARQLSRSAGTESYGDGTVELLKGGSHQSGNDIDLGTKSDGTRRRAEGGEYFAVINKRNSRKYRTLIPDVVKSLNNGSFTEKYMNAYRAADGVSVNVTHETIDMRELLEAVREIKDMNKKRLYVTSDGRVVEVNKNSKKIYKI